MKLIFSALLARQRFVKSISKIADLGTKGTDLTKDTYLPGGKCYSESEGEKKELETRRQNLLQWLKIYLKPGEQKTNVLKTRRRKRSNQSWPEGWVTYLTGRPADIRVIVQLLYLLAYLGREGYPEQDILHRGLLKSLENGDPPKQCPARSQPYWSDCAINNLFLEVKNQRCQMERILIDTWR